MTAQPMPTPATPMSAVSFSETIAVINALARELERQLRIERAEVAKLQRKVRKLEAEVEAHRDLATVARVVGGICSSAPGVTVDAGSPERDAELRECLRLMELFHREHRET